MRNKRLIIALLAAITFGLIAAVSVKQYLLSAQTFKRNPTTWSWPRSRSRLAHASFLSNSRSLSFPRMSLRKAQSPRSTRNLIGRVVVTSISPRDPLTEAKLAPVGAARRLVIGDP